MVLSLDSQMAREVEELRKHFTTGFTSSHKWRREQLKGLLTMLRTHKKEFLKALRADLNKPECEGDLCELALIEGEIKEMLHNLAKWMSPEAAPTPLWLAPASSEVRREPFGVTLIIAPFNYPLQLALVPVLNAIAAGNIVVLKPSELTPVTSDLLARLLPAYLDRRVIRVILGAIPETSALLNQNWDLIFFTGSETVGKIVHQAAAKNLTPCILELGGKSPVIIDKTVRDIQLSARRIIWGKILNAGQTCIAPDYILCHKEVYGDFVEALKRELEGMLGADPSKTPDYARIVSERHAQRLANLLADKPGTVLTGGRVSIKDKYIAPTLLTDVRLDSKVMKEEIFGPLLPILKISSIDEAVNIVRQRPNPLALYIFSNSRQICDQLIASLPSGGVCLNDVVVHFACGTLPFGGVASSGLGQYHGRAAWEAFTHPRAVLSRWDHWLGDIPLRYAPYTPFKYSLFRTLVDLTSGLNLPGSYLHTIVTLTRNILAAFGLLYLLNLLIGRK